MTLGTETTRRCSVCGEVKPLKEFYNNARWRDGRNPWCKTCPRPKPPTCLRDLYDRSILDPETGCVVWGGTFTKGGYGTVSLGHNAPNPLVHRLAWELAHKKPIPKGWQIHHTCGNRACVNVAHLDLLEAGAHTRLHRTSGDPNICKRGHNDWIVRPKGRECRECSRQRRLRSGAGTARRVDPARSAAMVAMRAEGATLQKIGDAFGVSSERARQIIAAPGRGQRKKGDRTKRSPTDGLGRIQRSILLSLARSGGAATRPEIEKTTKARSLSNLCAALNSLERRGLVARERKPRPQASIYRLRGESDGG